MSELRLLAELVHEVEEAVEVHVVEGGLDLVHHVEGRRPAAEHGEEEGQRGQRALATGEQRQLPHVLARRLGLHLDAGLRAGRRASVSRRRPCPPGNSVWNSASKFCDTSAKAPANTSTISASMARMTLARSRRDDFTSSSCSWRNVWRSCSASYSCEGERVDRAHEPQLALELAGPGGGGGALGQRGRLGGHGRLGLDVEVAAQRLDRGLEAQLHLGLVELGPAGLLARLLEAALGVLALAAQLVEADGGGPLRLALAAAALAQLAELGLDGGRAGRRRGRRGGRRRPAWRRARRGAPRPRGAPRTRALEPGLDLGAAGVEELAALVEPGGAHLEVGAERADGGGPLLEVGLGGGHGPGPLGGVGLLGLEDRQGERRARRPGPARGRAARRARRRGTRRASASVAASRRSASTRWRPSVAAVSRPSCSSSWRDSAASAWRASSSSERAPCRLASACDGGGGGRRRPARGPRRARRRWRRWTRCRPASRWCRSGRRRG